MDAAERLHGIVNRAEKRLEGVAESSEDLLPPYSRNAKKMPPEDRKADYQLAQMSPGGFQQRLREWKQQYPAAKAYGMFIDWVVENQDG